VLPNSKLRPMPTSMRLKESTLCSRRPARKEGSDVFVEHGDA
jgi:hypothetical protein